MTARKTGKSLDIDTLDRLAGGDPEARLDQMLESAQNFVISKRTGYTNALMHRAECIALAHAAGWSKYRIAQRLGVTRHAVDEAITRPRRSPLEFLAAQIKRNGGLETASDLRLRKRLTVA